MTHANRPKINPIYLGLWPKIINWAFERWHNNSFLTKKHSDSTFWLIFPPFPLLQTNFRIASVKTIPLRLFSFLYITDSSQFSVLQRTRQFLRSESSDNKRRLKGEEKPNMASKSKPFSSTRFNSIVEDDDDFQIPLTQTATAPKPSKKLKHSKPFSSDKENIPPSFFSNQDSILVQTQGFKSTAIEDFSLDSIPASFDYGSLDGDNLACSSACVDEVKEKEKEKEKGSLKSKGGYLCNSIESKLIKPRADCSLDSGNGNSPNEDFEELDVLLKLCDQAEEGESVGVSGMEEGYGIVEDENGGLVQCPLCGVDISDLSDEEREVHSNECLDKVEIEAQDVSVKFQSLGRFSLLIVIAN